MKLDFPDIYECASSASEEAQERYLNLIKIEYLFLFLTSITAFFKFQTEFTIITIILVLAVIVSQAYRHFTKPEQQWYRARALAESIKTITWRYIMGSKPFDNVSIKNDDKISKKEFLQRIEEIKSINEFNTIAPIANVDLTKMETLTKSMAHVRNFSLNQKKAFYLENRIQNQRLWYVKKADYNKKANRRWMIIIVGLTVIYLIFMLLIAANKITENDWYGNIEPTLILITAFIGWVQIKKHGELSSSYILTAHEIQSLAQELSLIDDDAVEFEKFVDSSEQAFSREHTQWIARKRF